MIKPRFITKISEMFIRLDEMKVIISSFVRTTIYFHIFQNVFFHFIFTFNDFV